MSDDRVLGAHLVGSVPLADAEAVFRTAANCLGGSLKRIPDGETGERTLWMLFQREVFERHPAFELAPGTGAMTSYDTLAVYRVVEPSRLTPGSLGSLGYARAAKASYDTFRRLKEEGTIGSEVLFQVCLPTPMAPLGTFIAHDHKGIVEPVYEAALFGELGEILDAIPHDQLSIQWDVAAEIAMWEVIGHPAEPWFDDVREGTLGRTARALAQVPASVDLGVHLCYGDFGNHHFIEPKDTGLMVEMMNELIERVDRRVDYVHLPVPKDRDDLAYFEPLRELGMPDGADLYLGLVHLTDGLEGTRARIETANRVVRTFGVATECGFGRRAPETVEPLMRLHAEALETMHAGLSSPS